MGRASSYAQRSSEGGSGGGDVTGVSGTLGIVVTNPGGPVPNVALPAGTETGQWLTWNGATWLASTFGKASNVGNVLTIVNDGAAVSGISLVSLAATGGAGGPITLQAATDIDLQAVVNILFQTGAGAGAIVQQAGLWRWTRGGSVARDDEITATGTWEEEYQAKVDNFRTFYLRRDEDTAAGGYIHETQQPQAGSTGTNRDSGSAVTRIQTPEAETSGGRWGQTAKEWPSAAVSDREYHGVINTTDATVTSVLGAQSNALPASSAATVFVKFKVRNTTTDASRTIVKIMHWGRTGAAAPTQRGATATVFDDGDAIAVTTTVIATGNALVPQFTGIAANLRTSVEMVISVES